MKRSIGVWIVAVLFLSACNKESKQQPGAVLAARLATENVVNVDSVVYESENLIIKKISDHVYQHISFLNTESFGRVPCNGMIVIDGKEAVVFDTPADDNSSEELIRYLKDKTTNTIVGVVATHFHADCVGGLEAFHRNKISSYASDRTISLLKNQHEGIVIPNNNFENVLELPVGDKIVIAEYFGAGHTSDNVIGYFPHENVIFGGCLIKELGAGKGNLEDANVKDWPVTVKKIKARYPTPSTVIPGHGKSCGTDLLDYTIDMFE